MLVVGGRGTVVKIANERLLSNGGSLSSHEE